MSDKTKYDADTLIIKRLLEKIYEMLGDEEATFTHGLTAMLLGVVECLNRIESIAEEVRDVHPGIEQQYDKTSFKALQLASTKALKTLRAHFLQTQAAAKQTIN